MGARIADDDRWVLPAYGEACFDMFPATVAGALTGANGRPQLDIGGLAGRYDHVLLVYFDAFGWRFYERHGDHPLLARARGGGSVSRLTSQFPSTTAAHMTTIHTGVPVGVHGVYEWFMLLPQLQRIIAPLLFAFAGELLPNTLGRHGVAAADVYPESELYVTLREAGVEAHVALPRELASSTPTRMLLRYAHVHPFVDTAEGVAAVGAALGRAARGYGFVYLPQVDAAMHKLGPQHDDVAAVIEATLDALARTLVADVVPSGTLVLLTSDHGMAAIDPGRSVFVNQLWPELSASLRQGADGKPLAPAGSSRDLFLHTLPDRHEDVRARLATLLEGRAAVYDVADLIEQGVFGPLLGERFRERVGDLVVLPYEGEAVYWLEPPRFGQPYFGQHGGLSREEMEIPLVAFVT